MTVLLLASSVHALIHHIEIKNDRRGAFFIENFGYEADGRFRLNCTDVQTETGGSAGNHKMGFLLKRTQTDYQRFIHDHPEEECLLDVKMEAFEQRIMITDFKSTAFSMNIRGDATAFYNLYFVSCDPEDEAISFKLDLSMYNPGPNYLSTGNSPLPTVFAFFFLVDLCLLALWIWEYMLPSEGKRVYLIHYLMTLALLFKIGALFFHSVELHYLKNVGHPGGWTWVYLIFTALKGAMFFLVVGLIGTGWAFIKPFLSQRDRTLFVIVLPLQLLSNVALIIVEETAPGTRGWFAWHDVFRVVDLVCCMAVLFPLMKSIDHLKAAAETDGKAARNVEKLKVFREFYLLLVAYLYFTRIIVFLLHTTLLFRWTWISVLMEEFITLLFFAATGYYFRPVVDNPYFRAPEPLDDEDHDELPHDSR